MSRGAVCGSRWQQLLVAFAALGMLFGFRPPSVVRGRLDLKVNARATTYTHPSSTPFSIPTDDANGRAVITDRDEDGTGEDSSEVSDDSPELERSLLARSILARSHPRSIERALPALLPLTRGTVQLSSTAPVDLRGLPVRLCRLTC